MNIVGKDNEIIFDDKLLDLKKLRISIVGSGNKVIFNGRVNIKGLFQKSIDMFYQAIEQEGDSPRLRRELAEVLYTIGNRGEALKQLDLALEKLPNNKNLKRRILKMKYGSLAFWIKDNSLI